MERKPLVERINHALDVPMAVLSLVMLALVVLDLSVEVSPTTAVWLDRLNWAIWAAFALEFVFKLAIAERKRDYLRRHWFDALVVIVPMFRVVRALRVLRVTKAYPLFKLVAYVARGSKGIRIFLRERRIGYLAALTVVVTVIGAAATYLLERDVPGTRFQTFGDALWWSAALMTTVAADFMPRTPLGRLLAFVMMVYAMIVVVYLISALASFLMRAPTPAITMAPPEPDEAEIDEALGEEPRGGKA